MGNDELVGKWESLEDDGLYSHWFISGDGTGWYEYGRAGSYYVVDEFRWERIASDLVAVTYTENREVEADGSVDHGWVKSPETLDYSITQDDRGSVLTFDSGKPHSREFVRRRPG